MDKSEQRFKDRIFKDFGQNDSYDLILFTALKIRRKFLEIDGFTNRLSFQDQYDLILITLNVGIMSQHAQLLKHKILTVSKPDPETEDRLLKYAFGYGFGKPKQISVTPKFKLLTNG